MGCSCRIAIRSANPDDAGCISDVVSRCYRHYAVTDGYRPELIEDLIERRGTEGRIAELMREESVFLAEQGGQAVGMVSVSLNEITKLYVRLDVQKQGVGRLLFQHAKSVISDNGFSELFLGVAVPSAEGFYKKMGLRIARHKQIVQGPCKGRQIAIMKCALEKTDDRSC